jgi:hypothetical protein
MQVDGSVGVQPGGKNGERHLSGASKSQPGGWQFWGDVGLQPGGGPLGEHVAGSLGLHAA